MPNKNWYFLSTNCSLPLKFDALTPCLWQNDRNRSSSKLSYFFCIYTYIRTGSSFPHIVDVDWRLDYYIKVNKINWSKLKLWTKNEIILFTIKCWISTSDRLAAIGLKIHGWQLCSVMLSMITVIKWEERIRALILPRHFETFFFWSF